MILLSWDGVRHDYPERAHTPGLDRVARTGLRAKGLTPVFPTKTFPNQVSLVTGAHVDRHGIVGNVFRDRERGRYRYEADASWIEAEPLWVAAERQGVRTACYFWVGSETDWRGQAASYRMAPFDSATPESAKVDQILRWLDLPTSKRPRLILSWWHGADSAGHRHGPNHRAVVEQLEAQDRELVRLLEGLDRRGLWQHTTLIIVSDHGMAEVRAAVDAAGLLAEQGISARVIGSGGSGFVHLDKPADRRRALEILNARAELEAHASDQLPLELRARHASRTGEIVVIAEPPWSLSRSSRKERLMLRLRAWFGKTRGAHGHRPSDPDLRGILYATGRAVTRAAELGSVRAIDVAATVSALLGIEPPQQSEGRPIPALSTR